MGTVKMPLVESKLGEPKAQPIEEILSCPSSSRMARSTGQLLFSAKPVLLVLSSTSAPEGTEIWISWMAPKSAPASVTRLERVVAAYD